MFTVTAVALPEQHSRVHVSAAVVSPAHLLQLPAVLLHRASTDSQYLSQELPLQSESLPG